MFLRAPRSATVGKEIYLVMHRMPADSSSMKKTSIL